MAIISIFGGTFGDDETLARSLAKTLNSPFVSREILVAASQRCDVPEAKLNEILEKEPHWWERWHENLRPYRIALQAAISDAALDQDIVYLGHIGHGLLPGIRHVLKVMLTAPMEFRIEQVRARQGLDAHAARRYVDQVEKARTRRLLAMFGTDWRDPEQYALILNMAQISAAAAEKLIARAALLEEYQPTPASKQALRDWALVTKIQAMFLQHPSLRDIVIDVKARDGEVTLSGLLPAALPVQEICRRVEMMPGVRKVVTDLVNVPSRALGYS